MKYTKTLLALAVLGCSLPSLATNPYAELRETLNKTTTSKSSLIQPQIVGGESATLNEYPFIAALVYVNQQIITDLSVNNNVVSSDSFNFSPAGSATGRVVDCGLGGTTCTSVAGSICLIERGEFNFSEKALNCEAGGGIGAIIYNNVEGEISGTLGEDFNGTIPVVAVTQSDGQAIAALSNATASINVSAGSLVQDSTCGGTVIGDKWILTAAHCVDGLNGELLKVNAGEFDLSDGADLASDIARIYPHPNYNSETFDNDVAVIELSESITTPAVALADATLTNNLAAENVVTTVIGWGGTVGYGPGEGPTSGFPDVLRKVNLNLYTNTQCRQILANTQGISPANVGVTENMICAAVIEGGRSSCQGDSGGPLLVETNAGIQQVGVVSWGIGCAAQGYPGVFARVAAMQGFVNSVTSGVSIGGRTDFGSLPLGVATSQSLMVTNNSDSVVVPSFTSSNANEFSIDSSNCSQLTAGQSCELLVNFNGSTSGTKSATISISSDVADIPTNSVEISANAIPQDNSLSAIAGDSNDAITWYNGGALPWVENTLEGGVQSGAITDNQSSILVAEIEGEGTLNFLWSVSSEENVDEPSEPYDALYLYINGELQDYISGSVTFTNQSYELTEAVNIIEWRYSKDINTSEGEDKAYVRDVTFSSTTPTTPPPTPTPPSNGGGGSTGWLLLLISGVASMRVLRRFR